MCAICKFSMFVRLGSSLSYSEFLSSKGRYSSLFGGRSVYVSGCA